MNLVTDRLSMRNYEPSDWKRVHIYGSDPEVSKYDFWGPNSIEDTKKFVAEMVAQAQTNPRYKFDFAISLDKP
ncbi:MAG: GNAT family N-acetyltransferase [Bdellovibrionaceae bacterium]|nr:GNAT family N-acetyltransferase [Bdellovibrio sp.]